MVVGVEWWMRPIAERAGPILKLDRFSAASGEAVRGGSLGGVPVEDGVGQRIHEPLDRIGIREPGRSLDTAKGRGVAQKCEVLLALDSLAPEVVQHGLAPCFQPGIGCRGVCPPRTDRPFCPIALAGLGPGLPIAPASSSSIRSIGVPSISSTRCDGDSVDRAVVVALAQGPAFGGEDAAEQSIEPGEMAAALFRRQFL